MSKPSLWILAKHQVFPSVFFPSVFFPSVFFGSVSLSSVFFLSLCFFLLGDAKSASAISTSPSTAVPAPSLPEGLVRDTDAKESLDPCALLPRASKIVSEIRGVAFEKAVECRLLSQKDLNSLSLQMMKREVNPERLHGEGVFYHLLGIIPPSYHYEEEIAALYSQNSIGFYDSHSKTLAILTSTSPSEILDTLVHELDHALQDQRFHLSQFRDQNLTSDELLARSAVAEGDALILEKDAAGHRDFQSLKSEFRSAPVKTNSEISPAPRIPLALQRLLSFSYEAGPRFLLSAPGSPRPFDPISFFLHPPRSSAEILHPESYPRQLVELSLENKALHEQGFTRIFSDRIGEVALRSFLADSVEQKLASQFAGAWVSDRAEIYLAPASKSPLLVWEIRFREEANGENSSLPNALRTALKISQTDPSPGDRGFRNLESHSGCLRIVISEETNLPIALRDLIIPHCEGQ